MVNIELKNAVRSVLDQLTSVITQINEQDFKKPVSTLNQATIGQHIRHTLEFFTCLLNGHITNVVNYDKRDHDKSIEEHKSQALATLNNIANFIEKIENNCKFNLEIDYGVDRDLNCVIETNFNRELAYNIEHAVHHMAIVKIGVQAICPYVTIPSNFGVANSTVKYKKTHTGDMGRY